MPLYLLKVVFLMVARFNAITIHNAGDEWKRKFNFSARYLWYTKEKKSTNCPINDILLVARVAIVDRT